MLDLQDAISLFEEGEPRQAADLLERLAAEMPGYATARVLLARSYEQLNEWETALGAWREAHQIIPNSPVVRRGLQRAARKAASRSPIAPAQASEAPTWSSGPDEGEETQAPDVQDAGPPAPEDSGEEPEYHNEPELQAPPEIRRREEAEGAAELGRQRLEDLEDLDRLISELETARIVPRPDLENVPQPDLEDDIEDVVSETLARIYASQGQYDEAAHVYELLADQQPDKADEFKDKASDMRSRASEQE